MTVCAKVEYGSSAIGNHTEEKADKEKQHIYRFEVRYVIALARRDKRLADEYINRIRKARNDKAADELNSDAILQYQRGSKGKWGEWYA